MWKRPLKVAGTVALSVLFAILSMATPVQAVSLHHQVRPPALVRTPMSEVWGPGAVYNEGGARVYATCMSGRQITIYERARTRNWTSADHGCKVWRFKVAFDKRCITDRHSGLWYRARLSPDHWKGIYAGHIIHIGPYKPCTDWTGQYSPWRF